MRYDLIIVGGGLVGAGLLLALRKTNLRIALIDARLPSLDDPRLFALNDSSCNFLSNIGLWDKLSSHATAIHEVHVSNQGKFGSVRLKRHDVGLSSLGYVIPAHIIEQVMHDELMTLPHVSLYRPATLQSLTQTDELATLTLKQETCANEIILQSPLVIGADGTDSTVRAQLDIKTSMFDYKQSALVTRTQLKRSHHHIAYERFTDDGAIAMLPLADNTCATIWTAPTDKISAYMQLSEAEFLQCLQNEFGYRLGSLHSIAKRYTFPLRMVRANKSFEQCVFLLGNSLHTLSPIAAQGFNLALYEVAALIEKITEKLITNDAFNVSDLVSVNEQIEKHQAMSIGISHRLSHQLNAAKNSVWSTLAIQFGMLALDLATPVKKRFISGMLGRTKRIPKLLLSTNKW